MELWLDAASGNGGILQPHPADCVLLAAGDDIPDWTDSVLFACNDGRILDTSTNPVGVHLDISDAEGQDTARSMIGLVSWIVLNTGDWQMIPLENIVAAAQGTGTNLVARIDTLQAIRGAAFALETGVDGLLLPADNAEIWADAQMIAAERLAIQSDGNEIAIDDSSIVPVEIIAIEDGGIVNCNLIAITLNRKAFGSNHLGICPNLSIVRRQQQTINTSFKCESGTSNRLQCIDSSNQICPCSLCSCNDVLQRNHLPIASVQNNPRYEANHRSGSILTFCITDVEVDTDWIRRCIKNAAIVTSE
jgi:hypothetical protein